MECGWRLVECSPQRHVNRGAVGECVHPGWELFVAALVKGRDAESMGHVLGGIGERPRRRQEIKHKVSIHRLKLGIVKSISLPQFQEGIRDPVARGGVKGPRDGRVWQPSLLCDDVAPEFDGIPNDQVGIPCADRPGQVIDHLWC